jgi:hypothetical protein
MQLPYFLLTALIVLLLLRLLLAGALGNDSLAARFLRALTLPVTATVGAVTPRIVPPAGVIMCAIAWLVAARVMLSMVALGLGVRLWG